MPLLLSWHLGTCWKPLKAVINQNRWQFVLQMSRQSLWYTVLVRLAWLLLRLKWDVANAQPLQWLCLQKWRGYKCNFWEAIGCPFPPPFYPFWGYFNGEFVASKFALAFVYVLFLWECIFYLDGIFPICYSSGWIGISCWNRCYLSSIPLDSIIASNVAEP